MTEQRERVLTASELNRLITGLVQRDYEVIGPVVRDEAIVYDHIESTADLPAGWTDAQEPGRYRLKRREDDALFGYAVGPQSWKKYLHPADIRLWSAERNNGSFRILNPEAPRPTDSIAMARDHRAVVEKGCVKKIGNRIS